jgi:hypothetical protein
MINIKDRITDTIRVYPLKWLVTDDLYISVREIFPIGKGACIQIYIARDTPITKETKYEIGNLPFYTLHRSLLLFRR